MRDIFTTATGQLVQQREYFHHADSYAFYVYQLLKHSSFSFYCYYWQPSTSSYVSLPGLWMRHAFAGDVYVFWEHHLQILHVKQYVFSYVRQCDLSMWKVVKN
jgi:hypothetical protein